MNSRSPDQQRSPFAAHDRGVPQATNAITGEIVGLDEFLGEDYAQIERKRLALKEDIARGEPIWLCPLCRNPVHLVCLKELRRFYFKHETGAEECLHACKGLSEEQINARKYNGAKESADHIRMKEIVEAGLRADRRFSDVASERVWKGQERNAWRKPDVQGVWQGQRVAFEVQLSTIFLRIIAERRVFYRRETGLLFWIFRAFGNKERVALTQEDLFYNNNRNLFLVNEETLALSRQCGRFALECHWEEPGLSSSGILTAWQTKTVFFDELTLDVPGQRAYYYDCDAAHARLKDRLEGEPLRARFERFWTLYSQNLLNDPVVWAQLRAALKERGIAVPTYPGADSALARLLDILYSTKTGRPIGFDFDSLLKMAHYVEDQQKGALWLFHKALACYGRDAELALEDSTRRWARKAEAFREGRHAGNPAYAPRETYNALVAFLFPELF